MDSATYREDFWKNDVKQKYYIKNLVSGPNRKKIIASTVRGNDIKSVLELGCSSGGNLRYIRSFCPDIRIVGLDINEEGINYGKEVAKIDAEFIVSSIYDLYKFDSKSFDLVFTSMTLLHLPSEKIPNILRDMVRISKKFIFNIESNAKDGIMVKGNNIPYPYAWFTDYVEIYKNLGLDPKIMRMSKIVGAEKTGVARDLIWCNLTGEQLKI